MNRYCSPTFPVIFHKFPATLILFASHFQTILLIPLLPFQPSHILTLISAISVLPPESSVQIYSL